MEYIEGMSAREFAQSILEKYNKENPIVFPINPFMMLRDFNISFTFKPFKNLEGIYLPKENEDDIAIVGININRPITRQRFTAAHELCHHLKDSNNNIACSSNSKAEIEKYAEQFAAELLMPSFYLKEKINEYKDKQGYVNFDDVLKIARYFGVSFEACLLELAYQFNCIDGDTDYKQLKKRIRKYKPKKRMEELGYSDCLLYAQLIDAMSELLNIDPSPHILAVFKKNYIYEDSRMEGIDIDRSTVGEIVTDLRINKSESQYCKEENRNIIEVAGLSLAYDYIFKNCFEYMGMYRIKEINKILFSCAPYPDLAGEFRQSNAVVSHSDFETTDYSKIRSSMYEINRIINDLCNNLENMSLSQYIKENVYIHHRLTVIHPFNDGNGRTSRAFLNMLLLRNHLCPIFFKHTDKVLYKNALSIIDSQGNIEPLLELVFKTLIHIHVELHDKSPI